MTPTSFSLLHALAGSLTSRERRLLSRHEWSISAVVLWEVCKLQQLGLIELDLDNAEVKRALARVHTWPLTWECVRESCRLDVSGEPADELIAATSLVHDIPLVTRDRALLRSKKVPPGTSVNVQLARRVAPVRSGSPPPCVAAHTIASAANDAVMSRRARAVPRPRLGQPRNGRR